MKNFTLHFLIGFHTNQYIKAKTLTKISQYTKILAFMNNVLKLKIVVIMLQNFQNTNFSKTFVVNFAPHKQFFLTKILKLPSIDASP
jgi:hypothetical protein